MLYFKNSPTLEHPKGTVSYPLIPTSQLTHPATNTHKSLLSVRHSYLGSKKLGTCFLSYINKEVTGDKDLLWKCFGQLKHFFYLRVCFGGNIQLQEIYPKMTYSILDTSYQRDTLINFRKLKKKTPWILRFQKCFILIWDRAQRKKCYEPDSVSKQAFSYC